MSAPDSSTLHNVGHIFLFLSSIDFIPQSCPPFTSASKHQLSGHVLYCLSVAATFSPLSVPTLTSSSSPSYFLFPFSVSFFFFFFLLPHSHWLPSAILVQASFHHLLPPLSLYHPCLSFRAEAAPVKLILPLCWGAPSAHRLGFPLTLSLWPSAFLSFPLVTPTFPLSSRCPLTSRLPVLLTPTLGHAWLFSSH